MYYILDKKYRLCGWQGLPYMVVDRERAFARPVSRADMDALLLCDGQIDLSLPLVADSTRELVKTYEARGVVRPCKVGEELLPCQKYRLYPNHYIDSVHWSVTGRCNSRCKHCYMSAGEGKYGELSHEQVMKIIEDMGESGVLKCYLSGGEPMIRSDFWEIVDALLARDIVIPAIYTNGMLVNERFLDGLLERGIRPAIQMSYDGVGYHDWLRGIDGAEKAVRRAFELCQKKGFETGAVMCVWKENVHMMRDTIRYLASVGCRAFKSNMIAPTGAWKAGGYEEEHRITEEEILKIYYDYLDVFYQDLPPMEVVLGTFFSADGRHPDSYRIPVVHTLQDPLKTSLCMHARSTMYISPEGRAMFCISFSGLAEEFQRQFPLVHEEGIAKCLTDTKYVRLLHTSVSEVFRHNEKCHDCEYKKLCLGGCRATAMSYHGEDILSVDEFACRMFKEGWPEKIRDKVAKLRPAARCLSFPDADE